MTRSIYPVRLHALEDQRHELVVRKLTLENRLRQIKEQVRDWRDRGAALPAELARERDETINAIHDITLALAQVTHTRSSEVTGYKSAFLKMAKELLPREQYRQIALAAQDLIRAGRGPEED